VNDGYSIKLFHGSSEFCQQMIGKIHLRNVLFKHDFDIINIYGKNIDGKIWRNQR